MPNRILRDGILSSPRINALSPGAQLFFYRLMSVADDFGRFYASPATLRGALWPINPESICEQDVCKWLAECSQSDINVVSLYSVKGAAYLQIVDFRQQTRSKSKYPEPPISGCAQIDNIPLSGCAQNASTTRARTSPSTTTNNDYEQRLASSARDFPAEVPDASFEAWWSDWSGVRGTANRPQAIAAWISVVTVGNIEAVNECTQSYLSSLDNPARGFNPDKFLTEQARDNFAARWPRNQRRGVGRENAGRYAANFRAMD